MKGLTDAERDLLVATRDGVGRIIYPDPIAAASLLTRGLVTLTPIELGRSLVDVTAEGHLALRLGASSRRYSVIIEAIGFLSFVLNVWGNLLLTRKSRHGWVVRIVAIICWGVYGGLTASKPMILNAVTFFCINVYGWKKWRDEERRARWHDEQRRLA